MHSYFETLGMYLLFTKYLTSTNMPTAQQKKWAQNLEKTVLVPHCLDKRDSIAVQLVQQLNDLKYFCG